MRETPLPDGYKVSSAEVHLFIVRILFFSPTDDMLVKAWLAEYEIY